MRGELSGDDGTSAQITLVFFLDATPCAGTFLWWYRGQGARGEGVCVRTSAGEDLVGACTVEHCVSSPSPAPSEDSAMPHLW